jgi:ArsR family transcriptional regulator
MLSPMKELARTYKALSCATRLRILALLTQGELCVCELMAVLQLPQSTVSRNLAYLRNVGLVSDRREGVSIYYQLLETTDQLSQVGWQSLLTECRNHPQGQADLQELAGLDIRPGCA